MLFRPHYTIGSFWWINLTDLTRRPSKEQWRVSLIFLSLRVVHLRALAFASSEFTEAAKFHLCLVICCSGSGETSYICLKLLLARCCLPRLMCVVTNSIMRWPQNPKVFLCSRAFVAQHLEATDVTLSIGNSGKWERSLEIHSVSLVRMPLREQSVVPHRRAKATNLLFTGCFWSLSFWSINNQIPWRQVQLFFYIAHRPSHCGLHKSPVCFP